MSSIITDPLERARFFKFAVVGAIGSVVDFSIMNLFTLLFGLPLVVAGTISFISAVISNFLWNRYWTYPESRTKSIIGQLGQFALVNTAGLIIRLPILKFGEPWMDGLLEGFPVNLVQQNHQFLSHNAVLAIAIGIVMLWNFFVNRYWTYRHIDDVQV